MAAIAARQCGFVARAQLRAAGFGAGAIEHRVRRGRLFRHRRGVYSVGHPDLRGFGSLWSAVLAVGRSFVFARSASWLWDLLPVPSGPVDVGTFDGGRSATGSASTVSARSTACSTSPATTACR